MSAIVPVDSATSARVSLPERSPWVPAAPPRAAAVPPPAVGSVALTLLPAQRTDAARAALGSAAVIEVSLVLIDDLVSMLGAVLDDVRAGRPVPAAQLAALTQLAKASILPALLLASPPQAQGTLPGGVPPGSAAVLPPVTGAVPGAGTIAGQGVPVVVPPPAGGVSWPTAPRLLLVLGSTPLAVLLPAGIPGEPRAAAVALQAALAGTGLTVNLGSGPDVGTVQLQGPTGDIELWTAGGGGRPEAWQALLRGPAQAVAATSMSAMLTAAVESGDPALVEAALTRLLEARPALQAALVSAGAVSGELRPATPQEAQLLTARVVAALAGAAGVGGVGGALLLNEVHDGLGPKQAAASVLVLATSYSPPVPGEARTVPARPRAGTSAVSQVLAYLLGRPVSEEEEEDVRSDSPSEQEGSDGREQESSLESSSDEGEYVPDAPDQAADQGADRAPAPTEGVALK